MRFYESETIELKEQYVEDIRKEIIAFANTEGGTIYVGVSDNGIIQGIDDPNFVIQQIANSCRDAISPDITLHISYSIIQEENKNILVVNVQQGTNKPYFLKAKGMVPSGVYVRQGTCSAPATNDAIRKMIIQTDGIVFEDMRSMEQNLTFKTAEEVFSTHSLAFTKTQMQTLGLIDAYGIYTNLGLLLSDQCPHIIKAAIFKDTTMNNFQTRREFTGSLFKQLEDAHTFIDMTNNLRSTFEGINRIDKRDYPEAAIREALLNTIVHRDYSITASTLIKIFTDRIEYISIGGLMPGIHEADILLGVSVCRNPKLANIFYRLDFIEAYGTGLPKIMDNYRQYQVKPLLETAPNVFKMTLPNTYALHNSNYFVQEKQTTHEAYGEAALVTKYIRENPGTSKANIAKAYNLSDSKTVRILRQLLDNHTIRREGNGKNTRYFQPLPSSI